MLAPAEWERYLSVFFYLFLPSSLVASGVMSCLRLCFRVCVGGGSGRAGAFFRSCRSFRFALFLFPAHDAVFLFCYGIAIHVFQVEGFVILTVPGVMRVSYVVVPAATLQV